MGSSGASYLTAGEANAGNGAAATAGMETLFRGGLGDITGVSGQLWINYVTSAVTGPVTKLAVASAGVASVATTLARLGLFTVAANGDITLVARTASQTGVGAGTYTPYEYALATTGGYPASYTVYAGLRYALGFLQLAGTAMNILGLNFIDYGVAPIPVSIVGGQADIAASYAAGTLTPNFAQLWQRGRP